MVKQMYLDVMRQLPEHVWPFSQQPNSNVYADGSHGGFNEMMRAWGGHVCLMSAEATNQLAPDFPSTGRVDKSSYIDVKKCSSVPLAGNTNGPQRPKKKGKSKFSCGTNQHRSCTPFSLCLREECGGIGRGSHRYFSKYAR